MENNLEEYLKTGLLGAYQPGSAVKRVMNDKVFPLYRDTMYTEMEEGIELKREMVVGGRIFVIRSIFLSAPTSTPTEKMLQIIDRDLEKK